ncbi:Hypothetical predicted protein, partial [Olea europaea subsp. europaea]
FLPIKLQCFGSFWRNPYHINEVKGVAEDKRMPETTDDIVFMSEGATMVKRVRSVLLKLELMV